MQYNAEKRGEIMDVKITVMRTEFYLLERLAEA